jgi:formylmethanofuran dehydrogenase subunit E
MGEAEMIDAKEFLKAGQHLHGHKCPAMPMGLRAGAAAMNALAVARARDKDLVAILELGEDHCSHCFGDGVQMITGCTFGKGNLRTLPYGKFGLTLVERATGRAVRVVPRAAAQAKMKQSRFFQEFRAKGVPASRVPDEVVDPMIQQVMAAPEDQILSVGSEFRVQGDNGGETFDTRPCDACGEMVVDKYLRVVGEKRLCIPCQEKALRSS